MIDTSKKYGILGLARSGVAAAYQLKALGVNPLLSDAGSRDSITDAITLENDFECEFGGHSDKVLECDCLVVSPGIPLSVPIIEKAKEKNIELISEIELGYRIKNPNLKLIAITGSNGKSTTTSLIYHILKQAGYRCAMGGNIGDAFTGFPITGSDLDWMVLEISSFQLDLIDSFSPEIALLLNVTPDHLNRYASFDHYAQAKFRIFKNQKESQTAITNADDPVVKQYLETMPIEPSFFSLQNQADAWYSKDTLHFNHWQSDYPVAQMQIRGPHNNANALAAILACHAAGLGEEQIKAGLSTYHALEHRLQPVGIVRDVHFVNDSKATNTDSVHYALLSFDRPIHIIMGGSDKGEDFGVLTPLLKEKAKYVYIFGATKEKMLKSYQDKLPLVVCTTLDDCIHQAFSRAEKGDYIVLSPACASYDMFKNFEHRGSTFIRLVEDLRNEVE